MAVTLDADPALWRPVRPSNERVVAVDHASGSRPLYELRVDLDGGPVGTVWAKLFASSPIIKAGDGSMMASDPTLVGSVVMWKVSQPALPHAERFIRRRIRWANEQFSTKRPWSQEDIRPMQGVSAAKQSEIDAVQRFLAVHRQEI
jgi:hypothetical protein